MASLIVSIVDHADLWAMFCRCLPSKDRLRITLLVSKSLVRLCQQHTFLLSVRIVDIHTQSHYLHLGICWTQDSSDDLKDILAQNPRIFQCRFDADDLEEVREEWAYFKKVAPIDVARLAASQDKQNDVHDINEMTRIVERNTQPDLEVFWGQTPPPYLLRRLKSFVPSTNSASLVRESIAYSGDDGDELTSEEDATERLGSHKYGATRIYENNGLHISTFRAPRRWVPSFRDTWAEVHQALPFAIRYLSISLPQVPDDGLFEWLPNMQYNESLSLVQAWSPGMSWDAVKIDKRFRGPALRQLSLKNLAFDENDLSTCQFLQGSGNGLGFDQVCIHLVQAPADWIRTRWLSSKSLSLMMLQQSTQVFFHMSSHASSPERSGITLAECATLVSDVLVSLEVPEIGASQLLRLLRSPSPPVFSKLRLLILGRPTFLGDLADLACMHHFRAEDVDQLFPCLHTAEVDSSFLDGGPPFLPASLHTLSITHGFDANRPSLFCTCLKRIASRCTALRHFSARFWNVTNLQEENVQEFVSLGSAEEWHRLDSLVRLELSLVRYLDVRDPELRFSIITHSLIDPDRIEHRLRLHAEALASQLDIRLAFIRKLESTLGMQWRKSPSVAQNDKNAWIASYNEVVLQR